MAPFATVILHELGLALSNNGQGALYHSISDNAGDTGDVGDVGEAVQC